MVTKVGSAGHVVESVIQYPQGNARHDNKNVEGDNKKAARDGKNHLINKAPGRIIAASESAHEMSRKPSVVDKSNSQKAAGIEREAIDVATTVTTDDRELARKIALSMELSQEAVKITVDDVNKKLAPTGSNVQFNYHEKTGRYSFKILDSEGKVIKEVPPEKSLDMVAKMFELAGILVDEKS